MQKRFEVLISVPALLCAITGPSAFGQQRGQYLSGMSAVNSGVMPEPGLYYSNFFYYSSNDRLKGPDGKPISVTGQFAIMVDNNIFLCVYKPKVLGGYLESIADVPIANGSLAGTVFAAGGAGLANTYFVPLQIGWHLKRLDLQTGYGFFAPTGRYTAGSTSNVGTGYWTNEVQAGATFYLAQNKGTALNAFNMYSWNTTQTGTNIKPGQNNSFDYSLTQMLPLAKDNAYLLQTGFTGYGQWQTSDSSRKVEAIAITLRGKRNRVHPELAGARQKTQYRRQRFLGNGRSQYT